MKHREVLALFVRNLARSGGEVDALLTAIEFHLAVDHGRVGQSGWRGREQAKTFEQGECRSRVALCDGFEHRRDGGIGAFEQLRPAGLDQLFLPRIERGAKVRIVLEPVIDGAAADTGGLRGQSVPRSAHAGR